MGTQESTGITSGPSVGSDFSRSGDAQKNTLDEDGIRAQFTEAAYSKPERAVNELVSNGITTTLSAIDNDYFGANDSLIRVVTEGSANGPVSALFRDYGMGMDSKTLDEALGTIGRGRFRYQPDKLGRNGIGFYSAFMLASPDGVVFVFTNPRHSDEGPFARAFTPTENIPIEGHPEALADDEYGTKIVIPSLEPEGVSEATIQDGIKNYFTAARIPVQYTHVEDGTVTSEIEIGGNSLFDIAKDGLKRRREQFKRGYLVQYEDEIIEALIWVPSMPIPSFRRETALYHLDVPITFSDGSEELDDFPNQTLIRIKQEEPVLLEGEHKGKIPVPAEEIAENVPPQRKDQFVAEERVADGVRRLATPTGNRESLRNSSATEAWLTETLSDAYMNALFDTIDDTQDIMKTVAEDQSKDGHQTPAEAYMRTELLKTVQESVQKEIPTASSFAEVDEALRASAIDSLSMTADTRQELILASIAGEIVHPMSDPTTTKNRTAVDALYQEASIVDTADELFMGVGMNKKRAKTLWNTYGENALLLKVDNTDWYDVLEDMGFRYLKNVPMRGESEEFTVPNSSTNEGEQRNFAGERQYFLRQAKIDYGWLTLDQIEDKDLRQSGDCLVVPKQSDWSVEMPSLEQEGVKRISVPNSKVDDVTSRSNFVAIGRVYQEIAQNPVHTAEGTRTVADILDEPGTYVIHTDAVKEDSLRAETSIAKRADAYHDIATHEDFGINEDMGMEDFTYAFMPKSTYNKARLFIDRDVTPTVSTIAMFNNVDVTTDIVARLWLSALLPDWKYDSQLMQNIRLATSHKKSGSPLEQNEEYVASLKTLHDTGENPTI